MPTVLDEILATHRRQLEADGRSLSSRRDLAAAAGPTRDFADALRTAGRMSGGIGVIAEVKRRSPSKGELAPGLDPAKLARQYEEGGASCLSVLTDVPYFGGSEDDLRAARASVSLPVLRKDFTVDERDLYDARAMGADAVLLIVAALGERLAPLVELAEGLLLAALVEVHDEEECALALGAGASMIGVNQRDLRDFAVDIERAARIAPMIPDDVVRVAESGIRGGGDVARLMSAGYDAVLVGEALVTSADPAGALRGLRSEITASASPRALG